MNKPVKVIAITGSVILVLIIALVVVAKVVITPERVRATVLPLAEEQLNRKVDFSELGVSLFSGINLKGFTVFEEDGRQPFVALDGLVLRFQILPLFTGRVVVDEVQLVRPRILVVRNADGSFNFSTLAKTDKPATEAKPAAGDEPQADSGIDLLVASVAVSEGEVVYRDLALQPGQTFELTLAALEMRASDISLENRFPLEMHATLADAPLTVTATIDPQGASGEGSLSLQGLALKHFRVLAGDGYPAHLEPLALDLQLSGSGSAEQAALKGACTVHAAGQRLEIGVESPALMAQPLPLTVDVAAQSLQVDALLPPEQPDKPSGEGGGAGNGKRAPSGEIGPFDLPLKANGGVAIQSLAYNGLQMKDFRLDWSLVKNLLRVEGLQALLAEGMLKGDARVDLGRKGLAYAADIQLEKVQANPLVSAFSPSSRDAVHGGLDLGLKVAGKGTQGDALKRNLNGDGQLLITEGRVEGAPLLDGLATYLRSEELKVLSFKETRGDFSIRDGALHFDSRIEGSQARMAPKGKVSLDGGLDVRLETRLNPELTRKVAGKNDFAAAMTDDQGWGLFPLRVKGQIDKPRFTLDSKAVRSQAAEKAVDELSKKIFKGKNTQAGEKVLRDTLKGLFGN